MTQQNRSGRYRGRGGGRSGRGGAGRGRGHSSRSRGQHSTAPKKKKTLNDYKFHVGTVTQGSDFQEISRYLINHIRGNFDQGDDIATALELFKVARKSQIHFSQSEATKQLLEALTILAIESKQTLFLSLSFLLQAP